MGTGWALQGRLSEHATQLFLCALPNLSNTRKSMSHCSGKKQNRQEAGTGKAGNACSSPSLCFSLLRHELFGRQGTEHTQTSIPTSYALLPPSLLTGCTFLLGGTFFLPPSLPGRQDSSELKHFPSRVSHAPLACMASFASDLL